MDRPSETKTEEQWGCHGHYTPAPTPNPATTAPQGRTAGAGAAVREQWAERNREMERRERTRSESANGLDKVRREGLPPSDPGPVIAAGRNAKSKEKKSEKKGT